MQTKEIQDAVKKAREVGKKRNFNQTFDLAVSMRDLDLKKPENKIKAEVILPHDIGKQKKIGAIAEGVLAETAKKEGIQVIVGKEQLVKFGSDKKAAKKFAASVDMLIAQPDLMVDVGKNLGPILAPRNKMPKPVPPNADLKPLLVSFNKIVSIRLKDQPVVHCSVGTEETSDEQVVENIEKIINTLKEKLPKGEHQIKAAHLKLTMGQSVKIGALEESK